jgi:hypothetical protein
VEGRRDHFPVDVPLLTCVVMRLRLETTHLETKYTNFSYVENNCQMKSFRLCQRRHVWWETWHEFLVTPWTGCHDFQFCKFQYLHFNSLREHFHYDGLFVCFQQLLLCCLFILSNYIYNVIFITMALPPIINRSVIWYTLCTRHFINIGIIVSLAAVKICI